MPFRTERGREFFLDSFSPEWKNRKEEKNERKYEKPFARCRLISTGGSSSSSTQLMSLVFPRFGSTERRSSANLRHSPPSSHSHRFGSFVSTRSKWRTRRVASSLDKGCIRGTGIAIERNKNTTCLEKLKTFIERNRILFVTNTRNGETRITFRIIWFSSCMKFHFRYQFWLKPSSEANWSALDTARYTIELKRCNWCRCCKIILIKIGEMGEATNSTNVYKTTNARNFTRALWLTMSAHSDTTLSQFCF